MAICLMKKQLVQSAAFKATIYFTSNDALIHIFSEYIVDKTMSKRFIKYGLSLLRRFSRQWVSAKTTEESDRLRIHQVGGKE